MTISQVNKILIRNRKEHKRPWSRYQLAQMYPCSRSYVSDVLNLKKPGPKFMAWLEKLLGENHG